MIARRPLLLCATVLLALLGCASDRPDPLATPVRKPVPQPVERPFDARASAKAHTELAAGYYELGNLGVALEEARIAVQTDSAYAPAHNVMGLVYMDLRENAQAQASFERALRLDGNDADTNHNYGWFLCQTGRERESVAYFTNAVRNPLYASPAKSHTAAASCLLRVGNEREGFEQLDRALRLEPNYAPALLVGARAQYQRGSLEPARELLARFARLAEPTAESLWLGVRIERRRGDAVAEQSYVTQLRRRFPNSKEFQDYLGGRFE
jgi:type IV pilus assembly protein PilF